MSTFQVQLVDLLEQRRIFFHQDITADGAAEAVAIALAPRALVCGIGRLHMSVPDQFEVRVLELKP